MRILQGLWRSEAGLGTGYTRNDSTSLTESQWLSASTLVVLCVGNFRQGSCQVWEKLNVSVLGNAPSVSVAFLLVCGVISGCLTTLG